MTNPESILVVNAGSSSIKFAVYRSDLALVLRGELAGLDASPRLAAHGADGTVLTTEDWQGGNAPDLHHAMEQLAHWLEAHLAGSRLTAIGHRVAIGGLEHSGPVLIGRGVLEMLESLTPLAPLHQPRNLEAIEIMGRLHPSVPQVACFDTAFHRTLPPVASLYGLPWHLTEAGAQRYGFHGLSYEYIASRLTDLDPQAAKGRCVIAHLGSGASMCALQEGKSIATTMGFSPLSGLVMATRPGDLDPGLMIWLMRERAMGANDIEEMLYRDSGLKGISGSSGDMRALLASDDPQARLAIDLFVYRVAGELGRLCAALGGIDALVFTAGIGEHAPAIRKAVCERSRWLGIGLDEEANQRGALRIGAGDSAVSVWVVPTDEELMVASHTARLTAI